MDEKDAVRVELGHLNGPWGTSGWVKVFSLTSPPENIFEYQPWQSDRPPGLFHVLEWRRQGPRLMARLEEVETREQAEALHGAALHIPRSALPPAPSKHYYWHDLVGSVVESRHGLCLGRVSGFLDAGVHDVLQVESPERTSPLLIPFVLEHYVLAVDPEAGKIVVDWEPEWTDAD